MSGLATNWWLGEGSLPSRDKMPGAPLSTPPAAPAPIEWIREAPRLHPPAPVRVARPRPVLRLAEGMLRAGMALALLLAGAVIGMALVGVARLLVMAVAG